MQQLMKFLQSMPFGAKMAGIGGLFLIPIVLLIAVWFAQINGDATFSKSEKLGVNYTRSTQPLFLDLESYRLAPNSATAPTVFRVVPEMDGIDCGKSDRRRSDSSQAQKCL
jgi:hypothetical protein